MAMGRPWGQLMGQSVSESARSSHSILAASRRVLILMAARQAMPAEISRRRSSSERWRNSPSAISRISKRICSRSAAPMAAGADLHGNGAAAEGFGFKTGIAQLIGDAGVIDLLFGGERENHRHQQALGLDGAGGALLEDLLEEDALMRHVLIDDPQAVAAGGDDEALVNLAEGAQIG